MKELLATSFNPMGSFDEKEVFHPQCECVVIVNEIDYVMGPQGPGQRMQLETFRFAASPDGMEQMAKSLLAMAAKTRELGQKLTGPEIITPPSGIITPA